MLAEFVLDRLDHLLPLRQIVLGLDGLFQAFSLGGARTVCRPLYGASRIHAQAAQRAHAVRDTRQVH